MKNQILKLCLWAIAFSLFEVSSLSAKETTQNCKEKHQITIECIPENLPYLMNIPFSYRGENLVMSLRKSSVFGENTKCLIDNGYGTLVEIPMKVERSYLGTITGKIGYSVSAVVTKEGLIATIFKPNGSTIEITPLYQNPGNYTIVEQVSTLDSNHTCALSMQRSIENLEEQTQNCFEIDKPVLASSLAPIYSSMFVDNAVAVQMNSNPTLRPKKVMDILEFEIGVEIGSRAFFASSAYNGNLSRAQSAAESIIGNLNTRFLSSTGVRFKLGTVLIRSNVQTDPLRNRVTGTGTSSTGSSSLNAFRDYWNNNPGVVGRTHDLAVYHVLSSPSGLAWVGGVGTSNRYGTLGGNGASSWANGTAAHEVGHLFGLNHVNQSKYFYEAREREGNGATKSGGNNFYLSIMDGNGNHNIGRMPYIEAKTVLSIRNARRSSGDLIRNSPNVRPYAVYDEAKIVSTQRSSILIDVAANDYDVNNDILNPDVLDKVSFLGGKIELSSGTGPGGRNQIQYTPPSSGLSKRDFFHYNIFDARGVRNIGAVYVDPIPPGEVPNPNATEIHLDFGTSNSAVFPNTIRVSERTNNNNFRWLNTNGLRSADRGGNGVNDLNRDFIFANTNKVFETQVTNGNWKVLITFGDKSFAHDNMGVKAEGISKLTGVSTSAGQFLNQSFEVEVRDGKLSLEFLDQGGSDPNWVVTRVRLTKTSNTTPPSEGNSNAFFVVNRQTGKKLAPENSNDGARLVQVDASNTTNITKWTQENTSSGFFYLKNVATGKYFRPATALDVSVLEQRPTSYGGSWTQWEKVNTSGGYFYLKNRNTKKYFRPEGVTNNSPMQQRPTNYSGNYTQWKFVSTSAKALSSDLGIIINTNPVFNGSLGLRGATNASYKISSILGKIVSAGIVTGNSIDVSSLTSGIYIVQFEKDGNLQIEKIVIN